MCIRDRAIAAARIELADRLAYACTDTAALFASLTSPTSETARPHSAFTSVDLPAPRLPRSAAVSVHAWRVGARTVDLWDVPAQHLHRPLDVRALLVVRVEGRREHVGRRELVDLGHQRHERRFLGALARRVAPRLHAQHRGHIERHGLHAEAVVPINAYVRFRREVVDEDLRWNLAALDRWASSARAPSTGDAESIAAARAELADRLAHACTDTAALFASLAASEALRRSAHTRSPKGLLTLPRGAFDSAPDSTLDSTPERALGERRGPTIQELEEDTHGRAGAPRSTDPRGGRAGAHQHRVAGLQGHEAQGRAGRPACRLHARPRPPGPYRGL